MRRTLRVFAVGCFAALLPSAVALAVAAQEPGDHSLLAITAAQVAVLSDGDFLASTYADGVLPRHNVHREVLTVLTPRGGRIVRSSIEVSNSVTAAPEVLGIAPDGRTYYVVDRLARATSRARRASDLAPGRTLTAIRVGRDGRLSVLARRTIPQSPEALAVHPTGHWLAVASNGQGGAAITLVPLKGGVPGAPLTISAEALGLAGGDTMITNVQWHPQGHALAVNDAAGGRVAFLRFSEDAASRLAPWGGPVRTGRDPFVGRFTPDGRHYLTSEWGRDFKAKQLADRLPATPGKLGIIRLATDGRHTRIGAIETDIAPEGLAVSPDGRLIATANMRGTVFPPHSPRHTSEETISLIAFDPVTGAARKLGDTPFNGVLPEGLSFDMSGRYLLATSFEGAEGAGLRVFRIASAEQGLRLVQEGFVRTPHGAHHVVVSNMPQPRR